MDEAGNGVCVSVNGNGNFGANMERTILTNGRIGNSHCAVVGLVRRNRQRVGPEIQRRRGAHLARHVATKPSNAGS